MRLCCRMHIVEQKLDVAFLSVDLDDFVNVRKFSGSTHGGYLPATSSGHLVQFQVTLLNTIIFIDWGLYCKTHPNIKVACIIITINL